MEKLRTRSVFVPGGQPEYTYVNRNDNRLEDEIRSAGDNLCKLVTVTGPTKSGKSVLTKRVFPRSAAVWIDGGSISEENDMWSQIVDQLDGSTSTIASSESAATTGGTLDVGGEIGVHLVGKVSGKLGASHSRTGKATTTKSRVSTSRAAALTVLQQSKKPLIIDDFHYLSPDLQGTVVRALKAIIFDGHPTILLAIPHRRYDAIRVEREMTARIRQVIIPPWSTEDLRKIPDTGLPLLNAFADDGLIELFVAEALGSPHLVQEFFQELCIKAGLEERSSEPIEVKPKSTATALLTSIAKDLSRPVFEALAKGPQQRSDRMQRTFRDGRTGDIYYAVLNAIARLKPGTVALEYEQIRSSLKDLLAELPAAHEVSRVLEHMSLIQAAEGGSVPVLDWDKSGRRLHITDPYFAFFLKWGADVFSHLGVAGARIKSSQLVTTSSSKKTVLSQAPKRAKSRSGRPSATPRRSLNPNESAVSVCLAKASQPLSLATIAAKSFPALDAAMGNSWARNSVRKLIELGLIVRVRQGVYEITSAGKTAVKSS